MPRKRKVETVPVSPPPTPEPEKKPEPTPAKQEETIAPKVDKEPTPAPTQEAKSECAVCPSCAKKKPRKPPTEKQMAAREAFSQRSKERSEHYKQLKASGSGTPWSKVMSKQFQ